MAEMNAAEVTVGSAKATGAIFVAPQATALPTDASATLPAAWTLLGFTSEAGVTITESRSTQPIRAWEGKIEVYNVVTEYTESVSFTPIQCNEDVAKLTWGEGNVVVGTGGKLTAKHTAATLEPVAVVIETAPREGIVKRYCCKAQLTSRGDLVMDGSNPDGRQLTFNAIGDTNGVTMYEYMAKTAAQSAGN